MQYHWACLLVVAVFGGIVAPGVADAGTGPWRKLGSSSVTASVNPGDVAYYDSTASDSTTTDSTILDVAGCAHIKVTFSPSYLNTNTGAEVQLYDCSWGVASTTLCDKLLVDTDADGIPDDVTLNGSLTNHRQGQQWQTAAGLFVDVTVAPTTTDIARTVVVCFP